MNNTALANVAYYCACKCNSVHYHALVWKTFSHNISCAYAYRATLDSAMRMETLVNAAQCMKKHVRALILMFQHTVHLVSHI